MDADYLLILRMKNGDDRAIEEFVGKYYPMILRYCHLHVRDQDYAEDMTQETFSRFFRTLRQYRAFCRIGCWTSTKICRLLMSMTSALPFSGPGRC